MRAISYAVVLLTFGSSAYAAKSVKVTMNAITPDGVGKSIGTITVKETKDGVTIEPKLKGLLAGEHGFHVHENPSCDPADKDGKKVAGQAAGGHFDPAGTQGAQRSGGGRSQGRSPEAGRLWTRARPRTRWRSKGSRWPTFRATRS